MATRIVTFLGAEPPGLPLSGPVCFEFEGSRSGPLSHHLAALAQRTDGPGSVLALGRPGSREGWFGDDRVLDEVLRSAGRGAPALVGFQGLMSGRSEAERWANFTTVISALTSQAARIEPRPGVSLPEAQRPSQILIDITHAARELSFLAAAAMVSIYAQRQRDGVTDGAVLRLVYADYLLASDGVVPIVELTQLGHMLSWEPATPGASAPPRGQTPSNRWARRAKTLPAIPHAALSLPVAINLSPTRVTAWSSGQLDAARLLSGCDPLDLPGAWPEFHAGVSAAEIEAAADSIADRALGERPTIVFLDADPTLTMALVVRLQRASVRCIATLRGPSGAFAGWREFPQLVAR